MSHPYMALISLHITDKMPRVCKPHGQACCVVHPSCSHITPSTALTKFRSNIPMKGCERENREIAVISNLVFPPPMLMR